jgi:DNA polymerase-3 subunit delta'
MSGSAIELPGQPRAELLLRAALAGPAHAYLLVGPPGTGKSEAVRAFAAALLGCDPRRIEPGSHPDLVVVEPAGEQLMVDQIHELQSGLRFRPQEAARRVGIVLEADRLNRDAANAFLKTLEEPPGEVVLLLVAGDLSAVLPTIRSRCQLIRFDRLPAAAIADRLVADGVDPSLALASARRARGDLGLARDLAADAALRDWLDAVEACAIDLLGPEPPPTSSCLTLVMEGIDAAGKAAEARAGEETSAQAAYLERLPASREVDRERRRIETSGKAMATRRRRRAEADVARVAIDAMLLVLRDLVCVQSDAHDLVVSGVDPARLGEVAADVSRTRVETTIRSLVEIQRTLAQPVSVPLAFEGVVFALATTRRRERLPA